LAAESERPDLPWEFHVVDSSVINAFALPGGKVFVSRGLIVEMTNEAQIAGVLGHEIGHVTAQHIGQQMTQAAIVQGLVIGVAVGAGMSDSQWGGIIGAGGSAAGTGYLLKFGRDQESQADTLGVRYMTQLGYNPVAQIQVMKILEKSMQGGGRPPEFLSTHPYPETRIERLEKLIPKKYPDFNTPGVYTFNEDAFRQNVLARIEQLPPAKHGAKQGNAGGGGALLVATCPCGHAH
jgi:predicted Zn-dependent protease